MAIFPAEPKFAGTKMSLFWILLLIIYNYVIKGFPNLEIRSRDRRTHPLRGRFIIPMQGGSVVYVCTNFEAASSIRSKVIRWSQNVEIGSHDPKPRPF